MRPLNGEQDFRWCRLEDGWHSGVLSGKLIHIRQREGGVEYRADSELEALLSSYFRLDDDIADIWDKLSPPRRGDPRADRETRARAPAPPAGPLGVRGCLHLLR